VPMLIAEKYPRGFSLGLLTSSGSMGLLFRPACRDPLRCRRAAQYRKMFLAGTGTGHPAGGWCIDLRGLGRGESRCTAPAIHDSRNFGSRLASEVGAIDSRSSSCSPIATALPRCSRPLPWRWCWRWCRSVLFHNDLQFSRDLPAHTVARGCARGRGAGPGWVWPMGLTNYLVDAEIPTAVAELDADTTSTRTWCFCSRSCALLVWAACWKSSRAIVIWRR